MTRLLQCGWESGDAFQLGAPFGAGAFAAPTAVASSPAPRSGTYCLKCTNSNGGISGWANASRTTFAHASKTELYYAFGLYRSDSETNTKPSRVVFYTTDTVGNVNNMLTAEDDGAMRAYFVTTGGAAPATSSGITLIGTASTTISNNVWTLIEVHIIASTTTGGTYEVKVNGTTVLTATSQRTCQTNANFGGFGLQFVRGQAGGGATGSFTAFDDVRVNDTAGSVNNSWPGDEQILMLIPNAAGDSTQFTRGGADSGVNYGQVDERPPNSLTDYVYDTTVNNLDLYNLPTVTVTSISAVDVIMQAFTPDGSGGTMHLVTKTGAGQSDGTAQPLTGVPRYLHRLLELDPADSAAWSQTKINALQVGPKVAS